MLSKKCQFGEPLHRLDKGTSGILLFSKDPATKELFEDLFRTRAIEKTYLAIVDGIPEEPQGFIDMPLRETKKQGSIFVSASRKKGLDARTEWELLRLLPKAALLSCKPITGRTHQIRVHFQIIGHPIVGDTVYGKMTKSPLASSTDRPLLHAWKLEFMHPVTGNKLSFKASLPDDMKKIIGDM